MTAGQAAAEALALAASVRAAADFYMRTLPASTAVVAAHMEQAMYGEISDPDLVDLAWAALRHQSDEVLGNIASLAGDAGIIALWNKGKNVYDGDPDL